jgi:hypothetical protein
MQIDYFAITINVYHKKKSYKCQTFKKGLHPSIRYKYNILYVVFDKY